MPVQSQATANASTIGSSKGAPFVHAEARAAHRATCPLEVLVARSFVLSSRERSLSCDLDGREGSRTPVRQQATSQDLSSSLSGPCRASTRAAFFPRSEVVHAVIPAARYEPGSDGYMLITYFAVIIRIRIRRMSFVFSARRRSGFLTRREPAPRRSRASNR